MNSQEGEQMRLACRVAFVTHQQVPGIATGFLAIGLRAD